MKRWIVDCLDEGRKFQVYTENQAKMIQSIHNTNMNHLVEISSTGYMGFDSIEDLMKCLVHSNPQ